MAGRIAFSSRSRRAAALGVFVALLVSLSACRADNAGEDRARPTRTLAPATETPVSTTAPVSPTPTDLPGPSSFSGASTPIDLPGLPDDLSAALEQVVSDLVSSGDAAREAVRVLSLQRFQWPDGSLGCTTADVTAQGSPDGADGYRILLAGPGEVYAYHSAGDAFVRCASDGLAGGLVGEPLAPDPIAEAMVNLVKRDWADETAVAAVDVQLTGLHAVVWPDASLGCPRGAGPYVEQETPGYRVVVRAAEREAIYHTNIRDFVRCTPEGENLPGVLLEALMTPVPTTSD